MRFYYYFSHQSIHQSINMDGTIILFLHYCSHLSGSHFALNRCIVTPQFILCIRKSSNSTWLRFHTCHGRPVKLRPFSEYYRSCNPSSYGTLNHNFGCHPPKYKNMFIKFDKSPQKKLNQFLRKECDRSRISQDTKLLR